MVLRKDSPPPKAVERSAGQRRTVDSSPFQKQEESLFPPIQSSNRSGITRQR